MIFDLSTPESQGYINAITRQLTNPKDLAAWHGFLRQYSSSIDFGNPSVRQAAAKSCGGGSNCCKIVINWPTINV